MRKMPKLHYDLIIAYQNCILEKSNPFYFCSNGMCSLQVFIAPITPCTPIRTQTKHKTKHENGSSVRRVAVETVEHFRKHVNAHRSSDQQFLRYHY